MKTLITSLFFAVLTLGSLQAQKYGHVNSNEILMSLPEVKAADAELESYYKQLEQKSVDMKKAAQAEYDAYAQKANNGEMTQLQLQQGEAELQAKSVEIQKYDSEAQQLLATKKQEVYQPILDKVQKIIIEIGKEKGYTMIFDTSNGGMVYSDESDNIMSLVKTKLGI